MTRHPLCTAFAALLVLLPTALDAGSLTDPDLPVVAAPPPVAAPSPALIFTLRGGATIEPTYFGSGDYEAGPSGAISFNFVRLPGGRSIGSTDPNYSPTGLAPRASLRLIKPRKASDHAELAGLTDIDLSLELGLGLGYRQRNFLVYADARYGVIGHESWVGELGADLIARPNDRLTLTAGPRLFLGDDQYAATYYGVTGAESAASGGSFAPFAASGGTLRAGIAIGATYALNDSWGLVGDLRYDRLLNDAADSPITAQGSADQFTLMLGLTKRFTLNF